MQNQQLISNSICVKIFRIENGYFFTSKCQKTRDLPHGFLPYGLEILMYVINLWKIRYKLFYVCRNERSSNSVLFFMLHNVNIESLQGAFFQSSALRFHNNSDPSKTGFFYKKYPWGKSFIMFTITIIQFISKFIQIIIIICKQLIDWQIKMI